MDIEVRPKKVKPKAKKIRLRVSPTHAFSWRIRCDKTQVIHPSFAYAFAVWQHKRAALDASE